MNRIGRHLLSIDDLDRAAIEHRLADNATNAMLASPLNAPTVQTNLRV